MNRNRETAEANWMIDLTEKIYVQPVKFMSHNVAQVRMANRTRSAKHVRYPVQTQASIHAAGPLCAHDATAPPISLPVPFRSEDYNIWHP